MKTKMTNLYAIRDNKADFYTPPFIAENDPMAQRMVTTSVNDPRSGDLHQYSNDFDLMHIGKFDTELGTIEDCPKLHICNCSSLKTSTTEED